MTTVHIVLSVFNGRRFIAEQIRSIQAQTHEDWRLWVRDDGSTDDTGALVHELAREDQRIRLHPRDEDQRGVSGGFSWLLEALPDESTTVACCDGDDVWLPEKLRISLEALARAESDQAGPVLVHTDLSVVDSELNDMGTSLWAHLGMDPEPADLRRLLVENVATGPTLLFNRALLERVLPIPSEVPHHDWWIALVATLFGRIVALPRPTVLYRRHDANHTGGFSPGETRSGRRFRRVAGTFGQTSHLRDWIAKGAQQAEILLDRYREELSSDEAMLLANYAEIPRLGMFRRKLRVLRHRALPAHGLVRNLALLMRA